MRQIWDWGRRWHIYKEVREAPQIQIMQFGVLYVVQCDVAMMSLAQIQPGSNYNLFTSTTTNIRIMDN